VEKNSVSLYGIVTVTAKETVNKMLILDLANGKDRSVGQGIISPIPQVDGEMKENEAKEVIYEFVSNFGEEDIIYTLEELFPVKNAILLSRVQLRPRSADHQCTVALSLTAGQKCVWPVMIGIQADVCKEVRRVN
jgi:hypothetical protein